MNLMKIAEVLEKEPTYRLKQVKKAIFIDLIENWDKATTLPQNLRQQLSESCPLQELKVEKILTSKDEQTIKALFKLKDYNPPFVSRRGPCLKIESLLMRHGSTRSPQVGRRTVCVSSQVGCSIGCRFCATGQRGFKRNLSASEIVEQVLFFARLLKKSKLNDKERFNLGARHISISTVGITEGVGKLAKEKL